MKRNKNPIKKKLSIRAKKTIIDLVANGGTMGSALRRAGYSESVAKTPGKVTKSQAFIDALEKVGLTDAYLAKGFREFTKAGELKEYIFFHKVIKEVVDLPEDHPKYKKGEINKEEVYSKVPVSDKKITATIERITGAELIDIQDHHDRKVAFYQKPDFTARKTGFELSAKAKGHLAQDKDDNSVVHHVMSEEDKNIFDKIFNNNKK